jgi:subtilisin family serine protease
MCQRAEWAKNWFGELNDFIRRMKLGRRQDSDRVRVAVLDTGLDEEHTAIQDRLQLHDSKICGRRSFIDHSSNINDAVGHGTAVCDILLRVAKVDLFVAKISETANFDSDTPQRVAKVNPIQDYFQTGLLLTLAQAIEFAASTKHWDVNIMVLSFGFKEADTAIEQAVNEAHGKGKIIFAAASNSGYVHQLHKRVSFPARMEYTGAVISIRSITGQNTLSGFSARPVPSPPDWNFMTLGEGIKAAWSSTSSLGQPNPIKYVSGTSFATPLAAGIAACVLDFSIQEDFDREDFAAKVAKKHRDTLWTCSGIRKIFEKMAGTPAVDGSRIILPAELFNPSPDVIDAHYSSRIEELMVLVNESK